MTTPPDARASTSLGPSASMLLMLGGLDWHLLKQAHELAVSINHPVAPDLADAITLNEKIQSGPHARNPTDSPHWDARRQALLKTRLRLEIMASFERGADQ